MWPGTPFKLNRVDINDGQIHYEDDYSSPKVDIYFSELGASATNLSNAQGQKLALPAGIVADAKTIGNGHMNFNLQFNPMAPSPEYQVQACLTNVDLPALNDFLRAYGKFDVAHGSFSMFTSIAATNQAYEGYIKVLFKHLDVFLRWKKRAPEEHLENLFAGSHRRHRITTVLRNQSEDQLATKIPISGVYSNSDVAIMSTIGTLLRNAFVRALLPQYDQKITTTDVAQKVQKGEIPNATASGVAKTNDFGVVFFETNKPAALLKDPVAAPATNSPPR